MSGARGGARSGHESGDGSGHGSGPPLRITADTAAGEKRTSARIPRRPPTDEERAVARGRAEQVWASHDAGWSNSKIASQLLQVPVIAVDEVLAGERPKTDPVAAGIPEGATRSPPLSIPASLWSSDPWSGDAKRVAPDEGAGWEPQVSNIGQAFKKQLYNLGAKAGTPEYVTERCEMGSWDDWARIEQIVRDTNPPPHIPHAAVSWLRERVGEPAAATGDSAKTAPPDPLAEALRAHKQRLADQLMEADARAAIARAEREAKGESPAPAHVSADPELLRVVADLKERLAVNDAKAPLIERIRGLESRSVREDPATEHERVKNDLQREAVTGFFDVAKDTLKAGGVGIVPALRAVTHQITPEVASTATVRLRTLQANMGNQVDGGTAPPEPPPPPPPGDQDLEAGAAALGRLATR